LRCTLLPVLIGLTALLSPAVARASSPDPGSLRLAVGEFDPTRETPSHPGLDHGPDHAPGVRGAYLVQFERPITAEDRAALEDAGATVQGYVPMLALEVLMRGSSRRTVARLPGVRFVGPYQASYKVSRRLLDAAGAQPDPAEPMALRVSLFPGAAESGLEQVRGLGARVLRFETGRSFALADVEVPAGRVRALARLPLVRHLQGVPTRVPMNDRTRLHNQLSLVADDTFTTGLDPSLDGYDEASGFQVKYGHTDGGLWSQHPDFAAGIAGGSITFELPGADLDDSTGHGTHTAGSLVGDGSTWSSISSSQVPPGSGSVSAARWRGAQPQAALHHISAENGYTDRQIFERHAEEGAQVLSNSWGYADCLLPDYCLTITDYDAAAAMWDEGVWDADDDAAGLQSLVVFFAAGNDALEQLNGCPLFGSRDVIATPGTAKNVITVGAHETDRACGQGEGDHAGDVLFISSRGPVDPDATGQGLFKPDVMAVGGGFVLSTEREGTGGDASASGFDLPTYCSDTGPSYRYEGGTSMACPAAAGAGGVVLQDLVANLGVAAPKPSLVKALLVNGARGLEPSGACNYGFETHPLTPTRPVHQGWGAVQAAESLYGPGGTPSARNLSFENEITAHALQTGGTYSTDVPVAAGAPFKVSLAWTDYPAAPGVGSPLLVNDLDLEVSGPDGLFHGNNFAGTWSVNSETRAVPDRYNVVENVYLQDPAPGTYTITVRAFQVSQDQEPDAPGVEQDFSLVWTAPPPACSNGVDDDGDGLADLADPGCDDAADASERSPLLACDDGVDNDTDGRTDHAPDPGQGDPGCRDPTWAIEDPQCSDGLNNDPGQDAFVDFDGGASMGLPIEELTDPDPQCNQPWNLREARPARRCGLGFELALLLPALLTLRQLRGRPNFLAT
jgi:hypothetical protein